MAWSGSGQDAMDAENVVDGMLSVLNWHCRTTCPAAIGDGGVIVSLAPGSTWSSPMVRPIGITAIGDGGSIVTEYSSTSLE